jgi:Flp pilus assembly protein TadD
VIAELRSALATREKTSYNQAEPFAREVLQARRETLGPRDPATLSSLNGLAAVLWRQGHYVEAERLLREAVAKLSRALGPLNDKTPISLNNLALLLREQGRYTEAEPLARDALQASRDARGSHDPTPFRDLVIVSGIQASLSNLAGLLRAQGRYAEAEPLYREALKNAREEIGPRHPDTLRSLNGLALLLEDQGRYGEADADTPILSSCARTGSYDGQRYRCQISAASSRPAFYSAITPRCAAPSPSRRALRCASPLEAGNGGADMVRAGSLACSGDFLLRLAICESKDLRSRPVAPRPDDGGAGRQAVGAAQGLRATGRQIDAQPA